jgi:1,2-diacylglycerol 3-alpha-glucosyltransferase
MHIAQCLDSFLPVVDGVGRVVEHYAHALSHPGNECYVITPVQKSGYRGAYPFEIVDFVSLKVPSHPQYRTGIAVLDSHYMARIKMVELDIVHLHSPGPAGVEALRLAERRKIPLVGTFHSKVYDDFLRATHNDALASLGSRLVARFYERCDEVWTVSEAAAETLRSYGYKNALRVVRHGTEMRTPSPHFEQDARARFGLGQAPILLYAGQIDFKKNLRLVIEAAALLKQRGRAFQFVFAGQGRDRAKLVKMAADRGLDEVLFTGHITDRDLLDGLYMAASLFVFPSLYETAGMVVGEAAMMGTPSVVAENTAPAEVVKDGVTGLVCSNTPESLCEFIEHYLFVMSDDERLSMQRRARAAIPLPWETVMREVEERYEAIIARGRRKKRTRRSSRHR